MKTTAAGPIFWSGKVEDNGKGPVEPARIFTALINSMELEIRSTSAMPGRRAVFFTSV